nr:hypothetical protein [uncultured Acetatifactor sp.]
MIRYRLRMLFLTGVLGGISLSVLYINPYGGEISLSEALLQLSGSRGDFPMGFAMTEMVSFSLRLLPAYLFELFFGIMLYRHFCTASIYIFSRYPKRVRWYFRECLALGGGALLFQVLLVGAALVTAALRYRLYIDAGGLLLGLYALAIPALWTYGATLAVNLVAVKAGSSAGFGVVAGFQTVCIVLFGLEDTLRRYADMVIEPEGKLLRFNPMASLVMGWHTSGIEVLDRAVYAPYRTMDFNHSLALCLALCLGILLAGAWIIQRHELLKADSETGV